MGRLVDVDDLVEPASFQAVDRPGRAGQAVL